MFDSIFNQDYATSIPITSVFTVDIKVAIWGRISPSWMSGLSHVSHPQFEHFLILMLNN
jgi:hypothetical protein